MDPKGPAATMPPLFLRHRCTWQRIVRTWPPWGASVSTVKLSRAVTVPYHRDVGYPDPGLALRSQAHSCRDNSDITSSVSTSPFASKAVNERTMRFIARWTTRSLEAFMFLDESCQTVGGSLSHAIVLRNNTPAR